MSLTKEEFDKRLDKILVKLHLQGDINGDLGRDIQVSEAKQALRQLMLDVTGDPAEDCDFCGSLDSIREIVKGE